MDIKVDPNLGNDELVVAIDSTGIKVANPPLSIAYAVFPVLIAGKLRYD